MKFEAESNSQNDTSVCKTINNIGNRDMASIFQAYIIQIDYLIIKTKLLMWRNVLIN